MMKSAGQNHEWLTSTSRLMPWVAIPLCVCLGLASNWIPTLQEHGFPLDDSWIHQVVGRNLAEYGIPSFIPGVRSSGSSSTIWPYVIGANDKFFGFDNIAYLLVLNSLAFVAIIRLLYVLTRDDTLTEGERFCFCALVALSGNFIWMICSGMEHLLFLALLLGATACWFDPLGRRASVYWAGCCCGGAILTRPEAMVFIPVFVVAAPWARRGVSDVFAFLLPCAVALGLTTLNNYWTSGSFFTVTKSGRKWLAGERGHVGLRWHLRPVVEWSQRTMTYFLGVQGSDAFPYAFFSAIWAGASTFGVARLIRKKAFRTLFILALAVATIAVYMMMLPSTGQAGRYQVIVMLFLFALPAMGFLEIIDYRAKKYDASNLSVVHLARIAVILVALVLAVSSALKWSRITRLGIQHINDTHVQMGKWLAKNTALDARIAAFDIGGIAYFSHRNIVDLGGLVDPAYLPYLFHHQVPEYLDQKHINLVVLPIQPDGSMSLTGALGFDDAEKSADRRIIEKEIVSFSSPVETWKVSFEATGNAFQEQVLYDVRFESLPVTGLNPAHL